jgi:hypothetical protein
MPSTATLIVMFNLKPGINPADYERWARDADAPAARSLRSVSDWRVHRVARLMGSDAAPPYQYVEVVQIGDLEQLSSDVATERMQQINHELAEFVETPVFLLTHRFE